MMEARRKEMDYFKSKDVMELVPYDEAVTRTCKKPISVRWADVNNGDDDMPNSRSRRVARGIRLAGVESIFAPTQPLEALRTILSMASTKLRGDTW